MMKNEMSEESWGKEEAGRVGYVCAEETDKYWKCKGVGEVEAKEDILEVRKK